MTMTPGQPSSRITVDGPDGGEPTSRRNRWLLPTVSLLVLGAIWSFRGEVTLEDDPVDLGSVEIVTTTTRPPLEGDLLEGWLPIDLPGEGEVVEIVDTSLGLFAAGHSSERVTLWRSSDGISWAEIADETRAFTRSEVNAIVETDHGLVAVGAATGTRPAVWRSSDGLTWEALPADRIERATPLGAGPYDDEGLLGAMNDVVVWHDRLVAVGWSRRPSRGTAWVSDLQGSDWWLATVGLDGRGSQFEMAEAVSVLDGTLYAVGTSLSRPTLWTSSDSMTWSVSEPRVTLGRERLDYPYQVASHGDGLVSVGWHVLGWNTDTYGWRSFGPAYSIVWLTRDGREWIRLTPEELAEVLFDDVIAVDPWLIAAGRSRASDRVSSEPAVWFSKTGSEWEKVVLSVEGYEWGNSGVNRIVQGGPGLIAGGSLQGLPELWVWSASGPIDPGRAPGPRTKPGRWALLTEVDHFPFWEVQVVFGECLAIESGEVWRSEDCVDWERTSLAETGLAPGYYHRPVVVEDIAYAVDETGRLWSSSDGRQWSLRVEDRLGGWVEGLHVGTGGELLLVEWEWGDERDQSRLWRWSGGETWTEIPLPELGWVESVALIGDRYVVAGWGGVWVSDDGRNWTEPELREYSYVGLPENRTGDRLFATAFVESGAWEPGVTRVLYSDDGLSWVETGAEFSGWADRIFHYGEMMAIKTQGGPYGESDAVLWISRDGIDWDRLSRLPAYNDSRTHFLPSTNGRVRVSLEGLSLSIWEWIPPGED